MVRCKPDVGSQAASSTAIAVVAQGRAREAWKDAIARLEKGGAEAEGDLEDGRTVELRDIGRARIHLFGDDDSTVSELTRRPMGAVLLDCRADTPSEDFAKTLAGRLLPGLLAGTVTGRVLSRRNILVVLPKDESTAHHAYAAGTLQLGGVLVAPDSLEEALRAAHKVARPKEPGRIALCMAGGGIEGMFYELGVLRALEEHLDGCSVTDFDIFSGISAGAVLSAFLANGVHPSEIADALHGRESRVTPVSRGVLFDPNMGEVAKRVMGAVADLARGKWLTSPIDTAMKVTPTALFSGDKLGEYLEKELTKPGLTNDFRCLEKQLFVGATDQDTGAHVTFGAPGFDDLAISRAVRASTAMTPYYAPERIGDRYFVDGIFTRTINADIAVANGATLVICIDPMTPIQVDDPGYVSGKGGFFNTVQSVKSLIRTRLHEVIDRLEESNPDVTVLVFSPTPRDLERMSGTLMRFFNRTQTEEMAFDSARTRIARDFEWLASDLDRYGLKLRRV